ncbi:MAG: SDR family oxidoreductase [Planktomarina sp.]|nr:3-oxoacyl-ACP reductase [Planktomarina sp.]MDT1985560.1 SDR family oxidoreductase [Planktomarina sp.]|tara:strand:+ start:344 stop:1081 length:738 start_codon:yes stop_codon:yes gene_type:complete
MAKTIIVTGAGSGIGASTTKIFLDAGWNVGLIGRREGPLVEVSKGHANALVLPCDVTDEVSVEAAFNEIVAKFGHLDVLFNNAGVGVPASSIDEVSVDAWRQCLNTNLTGSFLCARAAWRIMREQTPQGGRIINNGSVSSMVPRPGSVPYTATKHGITGLTKTLALDGRAFNINVGQIDIGNALTEMAKPMTIGVPQANGKIVAEAVMEVSHVANAVMHMARLPLGTNILFMTVMANDMPFVGRG